MRRRAALAMATAASALTAAATALWARAAAGSAPAGPVVNLPTPAPMAQIALGGPSGLLGVSAGGTLYALSPKPGAAQALADGIAPQAPLAVGHGRIAARRQDGALWVQAAGLAGGSQGVRLAPDAGLLVLPLAVIGVAQDGARHHLVRLEPDGAGVWRRVARSGLEVLPDARPLQADLDGSGDGGHLVVLAGPDGRRYPHAVLGDAIEATRIALLERHSLAVMRELAIPAPQVLEDIAPRRVAIGTRDGLLSILAGPEGGQLVLIDADPASSAALRVAARGPAIGQARRWMSPTASGAHWLSVHTPHIGGVLQAYRQDGEQLVPERIRSGVSNHAIGSRQLDLCAWKGASLLIPDQARRQLLLLDGRAAWQPVRAWRLPAAVAATLSLPDDTRWAALLEDGRVVVLENPGA